MVLLRHGTAVPHGAAGLDDADRPLIAAGEREARDAGRALRALHLRPARVVTSPLVRARQTAQLAAAELGVKSVEDDALRPGFGHGASTRCSRGTTATASCSSVTIPTSRSSCATSPARASRCPRAASARVDLPSGELRWLFRPRALRLIAKAA